MKNLDMKRFLISVLFIGGVAQADLPTDLQQCRQHVDDSLRLQCYDAIKSEAQASTIENKASPLAPPPTVMTQNVTEIVEIRRDDFGLEKKRDAEIEHIQTRLIADFKGWEAKQKFTFENGQVWQIADGSSATYQRLSNPAITIERGMMGSFFMKIEGVNRAPRVKRLK